MTSRRNGGRPSVEELGLRRLEAAAYGRQGPVGSFPKLEATICDVTGEPLSAIVENNSRATIQRLGIEAIPADWDPDGQEPPYEGVKDGVPWFSGMILENYLVSTEAELYRAERLYEALSVELVKQSVVVDSVRSRLAAARRRANDEMQKPGKVQRAFAVRMSRALEAGGVGSAEFRVVTADQIQQICAILKPETEVDDVVAGAISDDLSDYGMGPGVKGGNGKAGTNRVNHELDIRSSEKIDLSADALGPELSQTDNTHGVYSQLADRAPKGSLNTNENVGVSGSPGSDISADLRHVSGLNSAAGGNERLNQPVDFGPSPGADGGRMTPVDGVRTRDEDGLGLTSSTHRVDSLPRASSDGNSNASSHKAHDSVPAAVGSSVRSDSDGGEAVSDDSRPTASGRPDLDLLSMPADMPYVVVEHRMTTSLDREAMSIRWPGSGGPSINLVAGVRASGQDVVG